MTVPVSLFAGPGSSVIGTAGTIAATATSVASSSDSPAYGDSVTFTATVAPTAAGFGTPTGTVDFYDDTTGIDLGTCTLDDGTSSLSTSDLAAGGHTIAATYNGDDNFPSSQSTVSIAVIGQTLSIDNVTIDPSSVNKGGIATLSGDVVNVDGAAFTLAVDWGENQAADLIGFPAGASSFSITHQYVDAGRAAFAGSYSIGVTVTSSDDRTASAETSTTGVDLAPTVNITGEWGTIDQNQTVTLSAVVADPGENGSFTYSWSVSGGGVSSSSGSTSATYSFVPTDAANYTVSLNVTDADGNTASTGVTVPVNSSGGYSSGTTFWPFQPDTPTVTVQECDAEGIPDSSPVEAGNPAYFLVSVGGTEPNGTIDVFYATEDGSDHAGTDYTATDGDKELTFSYANWPQIITVDTNAAANSGTFSVAVPCFYDPDANIPCSAPTALLATATIAAQPVSGTISVQTPTGEWLSPNANPDLNKNITQGGLVVLPPTPPNPATRCLPCRSSR